MSSVVTEVMVAGPGVFDLLENIIVIYILGKRDSMRKKLVQVGSALVLGLIEISAVVGQARKSARDNTV